MLQVRGVCRMQQLDSNKFLTEFYWKFKILNNFPPNIVIILITYKIIKLPSNISRPAFWPARVQRVQPLAPDPTQPVGRVVGRPVGLDPRVELTSLMCSMYSILVSPVINLTGSFSIRGTAKFLINFQVTQVINLSKQLLLR